VRAADVGPGDYRVVAAGKGLPQLKCRLCDEIFPMQSNVAIAEELMRISSYLEPVLPRCPNASCEGGGVIRFGTNAHGTPRYQCSGCRKVFAFGGPATKRQRETHYNRDIFQHLMNAMPLRRIMKVLEISATVLYDRIDFLHEQCQRFAGERERTLLDRDLGKRYISVDRQKLLVNWTTKASRKNTQLLSIASADQATGYVFAANINFDGSLDSAEVERDGLRYGDPKLPKAFRRYARVWLAADWEASTAAYTVQTLRSENAAKAPKSKRLKASIEATYENTLDRDDLDDGEGPSPHARTPLKGMVLHEMAVMNAHIQLVTRLLQRAEKLRFFIDQESGLRAAIMSAIPHRVLNRTADAFYVTVMKDFTIDEKRAKVALANR
jgi:transposase-like protein